MLAYAIDNPAPATIILISGDRDFAYAFSILRLRQYQVVLVAPPSAHTSLTSQASVCMDWGSEVYDSTTAEQSIQGRSLHERQISSQLKPGSHGGSPYTASVPRHAATEVLFSAEDRGDISQYLREGYQAQSMRPSIQSNQPYLADHSSPGRRRQDFIPMPTSNTTLRPFQAPVKGFNMPPTPPIPPPRHYAAPPTFGTSRDPKLVATQSPEPPIHGILTQAFSTPPLDTNYPPAPVTPPSYEECSPPELKPDSPVPSKFPAYPGIFAMVERPSSGNSSRSPLQQPISDFVTSNPKIPAPAVAEVPVTNDQSDMYSGDNHICSGLLATPIDITDVANPPAPSSSTPAISAPSTPAPPSMSIPDLPAMNAPIEENDTSWRPKSPTTTHSLVNVEADYTVGQMSNVNSTAAAASPLDAAPSTTSSTSLHVVPPIFAVLVKTLQAQISDGNPRPLRSYIGQLISKLAYKNAGVERFAQYATLAEKQGIVQLGGQGGKAWISLQPGWAYVSV